jgi:hypothetical protein
MTTLIYTGPNSAMTLKLADGTERDVLLFSGKHVDLPVDHDAVKALTVQGLLVPPEAQPQEPALPASEADARPAANATANSTASSATKAARK